MAKNMDLTLDKIAIDQAVRVRGFKRGRRKLVAKLLAMGVGKGSDIKVVRYAPMGDPIQIRVHGANFSLRKDEAKYILVHKTDEH